MEWKNAKPTKGEKFGSKVLYILAVKPHVTAESQGRKKNEITGIETVDVRLACQK